MIWTASPPRFASGLKGGRASHDRPVRCDPTSSRWPGCFPIEPSHRHPASVTELVASQPTRRRCLSFPTGPFTSRSVVHQRRRRPRPRSCHGMSRASPLGMHATPPIRTDFRFGGVHQVAGSPVTLAGMVRQAILPLTLLASLIAGPAWGSSAQCARATSVDSRQSCAGMAASCTMAPRCCTASTGQAAIATQRDGAPVGAQAALPVSSRAMVPMSVVASARRGPSPVRRVPLFLWIRALLI
jgi:hypothetical protein